MNQRMKINYKEIEDTVYNYSTEYDKGFTPTELDKIKSEMETKYGKMDDDKFNRAMWGNTCAIIDGKIINYHCDVLQAIICGLENRDMYTHEWD